MILGLAPAGIAVFENRMLRIFVLKSEEGTAGR
jgi:hypothetical protein